MFPNGLASDNMEKYFIPQVTVNFTKPDLLATKGAFAI
jgi:hypothetical protein